MDHAEELRRLIAQVDTLKTTIAARDNIIRVLSIRVESKNAEIEKLRQMVSARRRIVLPGQVASL